nr:MAG: hypothetical protein [Microvirus Sku15]
MIMTKTQILEIVKIVCTAIISIATTLLVQSCTTSFILNKAGGNQHVETHTENSVDSTHVSINPFSGNVEK